MAKRRRLPNGMGSITKLGKSRGRSRISPYMARLPARYDINGNEIRTVVGCYKTYNEAFEALVNYTAPVDDKATLKEVYDSYKEDPDYLNLIRKTQVKYNSNFQHYIDLHNTPINLINQYDLQTVINDRVKNGYDEVVGNETVHKNYSKDTIRQLKTVMVKIYDHAIENGLVDRNIAKDLVVRGEKEKGKEGKHPFTDEELILMYRNREKIPFLDHILVMSFTGLRTSEYRNLKVSSIDLENNIIDDFGIKTDTGKQRIVYILETIRPILKELIEKSQTGYIYEKNGKHMSDTTFRKDFNEALEELGIPDHVPYDGRRSLATRAKKRKVKIRNAADMLGHKDETTTDKYYIIDDEVEIDKEDLEKLDLDLEYR